MPATTQQTSSSSFSSARGSATAQALRDRNSRAIVLRSKKLIPVRLSRTSSVFASNQALFDLATCSCAWTFLFVTLILGAAVFFLVAFVDHQTQQLSDVQHRMQVAVQVNLHNATNHKKEEEKEEESVPVPEPSPQAWASYFEPESCWWRDDTYHCIVEDPAGSGNWSETKDNLGEFDSGVPLEDCRRRCQEMEECYYFLHHPEKLFCRLHKEEHCPMRWRGPRGELILATRKCPSRCRVEGLRCWGKFADFTTARSYSECGHLCKVHNEERRFLDRPGDNSTSAGEDCSWYSFHEEGECRLYATCDRVVTPVPGWTTAILECADQDH